MLSDIDKFIEEVEARPAIWNSRCRVYGSRVLTKKAWRELCMIFVPNYAEYDSEEKYKAAYTLQRKWKSLRDSFNREFKLRRKEDNGTAADAGRKRYFYFEKLSFLLPLFEKKNPENSSFKKESQDELTNTDEPKTSPVVKARKWKPSPEEYLQDASPDKATTEDDDDPDSHFFMSLLPHFRMVPDHLKLDLQIEFMFLLKKYMPIPPRNHYQKREPRPGPSSVSGRRNGTSSVLSPHEPTPSPGQGSIGLTEEESDTSEDEKTV